MIDDSENKNFVKEISIMIVKEISPDELHLLDGVIDSFIDIDNDDIYQSDDDILFGDGFEVISPFVIEIVKDVVKEMISAGVLLTLSNFYTQLKKVKGRYKKKAGKENNQKYHVASIIITKICPIDKEDN